MAVGLRIWDENGNLILDITDRITKLVGTVHIADNGYIEDTMLGEGDVWYYPTNYTMPTTTGVLNFPTISVSRNRISWSYASTNRRVEMDLLYGVY